MRNVERIAIDLEVAVALPAVRAVGDGHARPRVLAMTRAALFRMNRRAGFGKARLEEAKDRVPIVGPVVTALTGVVRDGSITKIDVDVAWLTLEPDGGDRLELLPHGARRRRVARRARDISMPRVHRAGRKQVRLPGSV
jgi:hypothetical protein